MASRLFTSAAAASSRSFVSRTNASRGAANAHQAQAASTSLKPRTSKQAEYIKLLQSDHVDGPHIVIASGSAGSGKTALATHVGVQKLKNKDVKRLVITRPAICVDEEHGFLPGTLDQKMEPWLRPIFDVLHTHFSPENVKQMMTNRVIELCPLAFMRGRTFESSWIICDEAQNCTPNQMLMVMTRLGMQSKLVITGDPTQFDRGFEVNGLADIVERIENKERAHDKMLPGISIIHFEGVDVVRHPVIPQILDLYK